MDDIRWTELEITGYGFDSEKGLPRYRTNVYGTFSFHNVESTLPESIKNENAHEVHSSIPKLYNLFRDSKEDFITFGFSKRGLDEINKKYSVALTHGQLTAQISKTAIVQVLGSVKLELINRLELSEKFCINYLKEHHDDNPDDDTYPINYDPKKIFIVHGRDETAKTDLYDILFDNLRLEPIILNDQANGGKTLIEKFEDHTLKVGFVFVLLTPDDLGCLKSDFEEHLENPSESIHNLMVRARENVIYELGYFVGSLGRTRVCCIQRGDVELVPSDLHGLVTIRFKESVRDKYLDIEKELKNAGYLKQEINF